MEFAKKKQMTLGVILSYSTIAAELLVGLLYTPLVLHYLGQSQYGIYSLVVSFIGYLTIFNAGANAAYIRFYVQVKETEPKRISGLNGLFLVIFLILAGIGVSAGLVITRFAPQLFGDKILPAEYQLLRQCFALLTALTGVSIMNSCFNSMVIANERFIFGKAVNCILTIVTPLATIPLLLNGFACSAVIAVRLAVSAGGLMVNIFYCIKVLKAKFVFERQSRSFFKLLIAFIGIIFLQSVTDQINWQIDKIILARTHGTTQISVYSVGATFNTVYMQIGMAVSGIFVAQVNRLVAKEDHPGLDDLFVRTSRINMYVCCLIMLGYTFFGKAFVTRWAGAEYSDAFLVGWLLMMPLTVTMTMGLQLEVGRAKNLHQIQIWINSILCILNMLVSVPLAMRWGALGSALGTFLTEILICCIVQPIYIWKVLKLDIRRTFYSLTKILLPLFIPIALGVTLNYFQLIQNNYLSIAVCAVIFTAVYAASIWLFAMNNEEKGMITRIITRKK